MTLLYPGTNGKFAREWGNADPNNCLFVTESTKFAKMSRCGRDRSGIMSACPKQRLKLGRSYRPPRSVL